MRIAIISDIHGNKEALDAVLDDISHQKVDLTVCAGDFIDPLPDSKIVWEQLKACSIPVIRGNHEDYIISVHEEPSSPQSLLENWAPVRTTAKLFSKSEADELKRLPLKYYIEEANALICHASPNSNKVGWRESVDPVANDLSAESAEIIVCGHWHIIREQEWKSKKLVIAGSVGVPLHGNPLSEYAIIEKKNGKWRVNNRFIPFDHLAAARKYVESGFVADSAPVSYLLLDEFITNERRIAPFIQWKKSNPDLDRLNWGIAVKMYCEQIGRWDEIKRAARI